MQQVFPCRMMLRRASALCASYGWTGLFGDLSGGAIAALIALPYGLALASLMGLPPVLGVLTSILSAPVLFLLGRNPLLIGGVTGATVPLLAAVVQSRGFEGAAQVSVLAAVIMLLLCPSPLGRLVAAIPDVCVRGFSAGIGAMMIVSQLQCLLGVPPLRNGGSPARQLVAVIQRLGHARALPLVVAATVVCVAALAARWSPRLPAPLLGIAAAVVLARLLGIHPAEIGLMPPALPRLAHFAWSIPGIVASLPAAFALAGVSSLNVLMTSRVVDRFRTHDASAPCDAAAELRAFGVANLVTSLFGAPPSVAMPARSLAVVRCGGVTRLANLFHAVLLAMILWLGAAVVAHIPVAALAGVTAWIGLCLLESSGWRTHHLLSPRETATFLVTAASVLAMNAALAVAIGCAVYALGGSKLPWRAAVAWQRLAGALRAGQSTRIPGEI